MYLTWKDIMKQNKRLNLYVLLSLCLLCLVLSGCANTHIKLKLPARNAPFAQRVAAYHKAKLKGFDANTTIRVKTKNGNVYFRDDGDLVLFLGNGDILIQVEDLLAGVEPNSKTAKSIILLKGDRLTANLVMFGGGFGGFLLGCAVSVGGIVTSTQNSPNLVPIISGAAFALTVPFIFLYVGSTYYDKMIFHKAQAIKTYNQDLMKRLRITPKKP